MMAVEISLYFRPWREQHLGGKNRPSITFIAVRSLLGVMSKSTNTLFWNKMDFETDFSLIFKYPISSNFWFTWIGLGPTRWNWDTLLELGHFAGNLAPSWPVRCWKVLSSWFLSQSFCEIYLHNSFLTENFISQQLFSFCNSAVNEASLRIILLFLFSLHIPIYR